VSIISFVVVYELLALIVVAVVVVVVVTTVVVVNGYELMVLCLLSCLFAVFPFFWLPLL